MRGRVRKNIDVAKSAKEGSWKAHFAILLSVFAIGFCIKNEFSNRAQGNGFATDANSNGVNMAGGANLSSSNPYNQEIACPDDEVLVGITAESKAICRKTSTNSGSQSSSSFIGGWNVVKVCPTSESGKVSSACLDSPESYPECASDVRPFVIIPNAYSKYFIPHPCLDQNEKCAMQFLNAKNARENQRFFMKCDQYSIVMKSTDPMKKEKDK